MGKEINYMNDKSKYPGIIIRKGYGTFSSNKVVFKAYFEIIHYPQQTIIETQTDDKNLFFKLRGSSNEKWELQGETDDNKHVNAKSLLNNNISGNQLTFVSYKDLSFCEDEIHKISYAEFPLVGIYCDSFNLEYSDWKINCEGQKDQLEKVKKNSKNWNLQLEGNTLRLRNPVATKNQFLSKANNITSVLSLALGNDVVFNRQLYYHHSNLVIEDWRRKVDYHFGAHQCIPVFKLNTFLESTLANFEKWNNKKRKTFFSTVSYINSSSKGYLEDRLLRISIAWESLAQSWSIKSRKADNNKLELFKKYLKKSIKEFELPSEYDKEFLSDRILRSIEWEKINDTLISFSDQFCLNQDRLGLDFKSLIRIRNDVAHTGHFRKKYSKDFLINLLHKHIFGLQIILLIELGYNDLVETQKDKWITFVKINELLQKKPTHNRSG